MSDSLADDTIQSFLEKLGSSEPAPGGGAAAALVGALAAALGEMVCGLTTGKPKFAAVQERVATLAKKFEHRRSLLTALITGDARAYSALSTAFKLDKADQTRRTRIEGAALHAAAIPLCTVALVRGVRRDVEELFTVGNPNLKADMESARAMAACAIEAALANVRANLPLLEEGERVRVESEIARLSAPLSTTD